MGILSELEPKEVLYWFEQISALPRGSGREEKIAAFLTSFARERGLRYTEDEWHNVCIWKSAGPGMKDRPTLVLQAHTDMMCAKDPGVIHDFREDGLELLIEGDHIRANGTTLGADDGIGVAYELAILDDRELAHPPIEAVFTVSEEIGMVGARHFDMSLLNGRRMINFDAGGFTEGRIYVGCAGHCRAMLSQRVEYVPCEPGKYGLRIRLNGLRGGHSGGDIARGRGNSSVIVGRLLNWILQQDGTDVAYFCSGDPSQENKNGIPDCGEIVVCTENVRQIRKGVNEWEAVLRSELKDVDDGVRLSVVTAERTERVLSKISVKTATQIMQILPNGVQSMQCCFPDTPESSCNIGNIELDRNQVLYYISVRSCKNSLIDQINEKYRVVSELTGCEFIMGERLPGWDYRADSGLRKLTDAEYRREFGKAPRFKVTHASTECALFGEKIPDMDIISMGPIIYEEHTTKEYMGIESVGVLWKFLKEILRQM